MNAIENHQSVDNPDVQSTISVTSQPHQPTSQALRCISSHAGMPPLDLPTFRWAKQWTPRLTKLPPPTGSRSSRQRQISSNLLLKVRHAKNANMLLFQPKTSITPHQHRACCPFPLDRGVVSKNSNICLFSKIFLYEKSKFRFISEIFFHEIPLPELQSTQPPILYIFYNMG